MTRVYRFGDFELRPAQRQLLGNDGQPVALGGRAFDVLGALVARAGELLSKDDLLAQAWPGVVVEENNLQVQVSALRKALGAGAITTSAGRGYRFTLPVSTSDDAAPASPHARRDNLPQPLTSFVGHDDDLDEYAALLRETRLLTLTGIGGCGKTRLALELARRVLAAHPDGVWYVDLAPLQDADRVALTVATTLGLREEEGRGIVETLAAALAGRRALVVLDNCEHLMQSVASLARELLSTLPTLTVLAASREGLGVSGERVVTVRSLAFPASGASADLEALERCESVRLFVDRVRLAVPRFALDAGNAAAVAEICRRLDGIPLAIELAAARVKLLSVDEIRARLDDRFRLLTGGSRTALGRQQTLLAAIRWSYDHLDEADQALLRRLSVFVGGWTLDGAVEVAGDGADEYAVLERLARLVDQSLVSVRHVAGGASRYAMLETVRQYAQERLDDAGEGAARRDAHLRYCVALAERAAPHLVGHDQIPWLAALDLDAENLLAAHAWADRSDEGAMLGLRLVFALLVYFRNRGLLALQYRLGVESLARPGVQAPTLERGRALLAAGEPAYFLGRYADARRCAEAARAIALGHDDPGLLSASARLLGYASLADGQADAALASFQDAVVAARRLGEGPELAGSLNGLAELHRASGRPAQARPLYEEALALHQRLDDGGGCAVGHVNLALTHILLGAHEPARDALAQGMDLVAALGSRRASIVLIDGVTGLAEALGAHAFAARLHGAAETGAAAIGFRREPADEAFIAPCVARVRAALGHAAFDAAIDGGRRAPFDDTFAEARRWVERALVA